MAQVTKKPPKERDIPSWKIELASMVASGKRFPEGTGQSRLKQFAAERGLNWQTVSANFYGFQKKIPTEILDILTDPKRADEIKELDGVITDDQAEPKSPGDQQPQEVQAEEVQAPNPKVAEEPKTEEPTAAAPKTSEKALWPDKPQATASNPFADIYPVGTTIEVKVEALIDRAGVIVHPVGDKYSLEGFIHIKEITNKFVSDLNKFFRVGDIIRAKVVGFEPARQQLRLSTRDLPIKEYGVKDPAAGYKAAQGGDKREGVRVEEQNQRLEALRLELQEQQQQQEANQKMSTVPAVAEKYAALSVVMQDEMKEVRAFMKGVIGSDPSDAAVDAFGKIITEFGMFKTSLALGKIAEGFSPDIGLILAEQVKSKLGGHPLSS